MAFGSSIKAAAAYVQLELRNGLFNRQWQAFQSELKAKTTLLQRGTAGMVNLGLNTQGFLSSLKSVTSAFTSSVARIRSAGRAILFTGTVTALPFAAATAELIKFDDKMRTVRAVSEATQEDFIRLTQKAKEFSEATRFSAADVADLMIELGRAGFIATEIEKMTKAILQLSQATGVDTTTAAVAAATAMRQFQLPVEEITRVVDGLTVTANKSFSSIQSLSESFQYAGPIAAQLNYSLEETLALMGTLANFGIKGSEAGTALRRISTITAAENDKMQEILGVTFRTAEGNARKMIEVLNEINVLTEDLGTSERAAKFNEAFGLLGITSATALSNAVVNVKELEDAIVNATGATARAAEIMDAGVGGAFGRLLSKAKLVAIQLADTLSDALIGTEKILSKNFRLLTDFIERNRDLIPILAQITAGFTALGIAIFGLGVALSPLAAAATIVGGAFTTLSIAVGGVTTAIGLFTGALGLGGIPAAVLALGTLVIAFNEIKKAANSAKVEWEATFSGLGEIATNAVKAIRDAITGGDLELAWQILADSAKFIFDQTLLRMKIQMQEFYNYWLDKLQGPGRALGLEGNVQAKEIRDAELDNLRKQLDPRFRAPGEAPEEVNLAAELRKIQQERDKINLSPRRKDEDHQQQIRELDELEAKLKARGVIYEDEIAILERLREIRRDFRNDPESRQAATAEGLKLLEDPFEGGRFGGGLPPEQRALNEKVAKAAKLREDANAKERIKAVVDNKLETQRKRAEAERNKAIKEEQAGIRENLEAPKRAREAFLKDMLARRAELQARQKDVLSGRAAAVDAAVAAANNPDRVRLGVPLDINQRVAQALAANAKKQEFIDFFLQGKLRGDNDPLQFTRTQEEQREHEKKVREFEFLKKKREEKMLDIMDDSRRSNQRTAKAVEGIGTV